MSVDPPTQRRTTGRLKRRLVVVLVLLLAAAAWDLNRPPDVQWSARLLLAGIGAYQATGSRLMPAVGIHCRFEPTCSHYAAAAIRRDGALSGSVQAMWRLLRCGPWTPAGTVDAP